MSQDYTDNKPNIQTLFPEGATTLSGEGVAGFQRIETWLTPDRLRNEFLFGIPLISPMNNQEMSDDLLKVFIRRAASHLETKCKVTVSPQQKFDRIEFDRVKYLQGWNQLVLKYGNVQSVQEVSIRAVDSVSSPYNNNPSVDQAEGSVLYSVPLDWIDVSYATKGILHFVPLQTTFSSYGVVGPSAGAAAPLFAIFSQLQWIPAFWAVKYTVGFKENAVPSEINQLIGDYAALNILSQLSALNRTTSQSISVDGTSQSTTTPGPQIYAKRCEDLEKEIIALEDLIKHRFGKADMFMQFI